MNTRIKELADQCYNLPDIPEALYYRKFDKEKFAELIVLECAKAIADDDLAKDCDTFLMDSYAKGMRYSVEVIKEHFGVKE